MRDERFIAVHRGGLLDLQRHRLLALWAADAAERVLHLFEASSEDDRPRRAIEVARAWGRGEVSTATAQRAAMDAHRAARESSDEAAEAAARAAGHAAATAHMADHAPGAAAYAVHSRQSAGENADAERQWQIDQLPDAVREMVVSFLSSRRLEPLAARIKAPLAG